MTAGLDTFHGVHRLLKRKWWSEALAELYDAESGRVRGKYAEDRNHAWYLIGNIKYKQRRFSEAAGAFRKSIRSWPKDYQAMMAIANCYSELGMPRWSAYYLRKAIKIQPKDARLFFNLGNALLDLGDYDSAISSYKRACRYADQALVKKCERNALLAERRRRSN